MVQAVVIGGGAVGMAIAIRLQQKGYAVSVVNEPSPQRPASWGNAGHIAIEQIAPLASFSTLCGAPGRLVKMEGGLAFPLAAMASWLPFSLRLLLASTPRRYAAGVTALKSLLSQSMPAWQRYVATLNNPYLIQRDGHYIAWNSKGSATAGKKHWLSADVGTAHIRAIAAEELGTLQGLTRRKIADAVYCEGTGQIHDPDLFFDAVHQHFLSNGGTFVAARAVALPCTDGRARVQLDDGRVLQADHVIVAGGVASKSLLTKIGHCVPIIAERGYHIQFSAGNWPAGLQPVVFEDYAMILTRFASNVRAAGYVEYATPGRKADPRKWEQLLRNVRDLGLSLDHQVSEWMGARPTLPDYLPAIGRSRHALNLFYAFGHQHLGLTLAPVTGEIMAQMVSGHIPDIAVAPFDLERFG